MENAWDREARALEYIKDIDHPHIIKCIAAIRRGDKRYFMFPWADGDSLRDHWKRCGQRDPDVPTISQAIRQLYGLADALDRLHNYKRPRNHSDSDAIGIDGLIDSIPNVQVQDEDDEVILPVEVSTGDNIRHGDLKPENLLCFGGSSSEFGIIKIADMGLAKRHIVATQHRSRVTNTRYGTILYEPPEAAPIFKVPTSRLYDIWSIGCITLEMVIWILYGNDALDGFYAQLKSGTKQVCQYYQLNDYEDGTRPVVHPVVRQWIEHLKQYDPECSRGSAIGDLLETVENKLLVVPLPPTNASTMGYGRGFAFPEDENGLTRYRCTAAQFRDALDEIIVKMKQSSGYVLVGKSRQNIRKLPLKHNGSTNLETPQGRHGMSQQNNDLLARPDIGVLSNSTDRTIRPGDYTLPPLKDWEFIVDNEFAERMSSQSTFYETSHKPGAFCNRCIGLNFWAPGFNLGVTMVDLRARAPNCDFCRLLVRVCEHTANIMDGEVHIERRQSNLALLEDSYPMLSIFRTPVPGRSRPKSINAPVLLTRSRRSSAHPNPNWFT